MNCLAGYLALSFAQIFWIAIVLYLASYGLTRMIFSALHRRQRKWW